MSLDELKERVRKRIQRIQETDDQGVYAKFYLADATALLAALEEPPTPSEDTLCPCPECGSLRDNIYCAFCTPIPQ